MPGPLVETPSGGLRGDIDGDIAVFKGIPYGTAQRFRPPVAAAPWSGTHDARHFGPIAPQPDSLLTGPTLPATSEDCQSLNVWAPAEAVGAPVMVWFHGGGFTTGMGSIPWYHGTRLAQRGVVVVTINYRLGPLGFLHLASVGGEEWDGAANCGILDQALALQWVAEHIESFGGDPTRVTIFGESAGAMSVGTHLALPASRGLFAQAIAQSGAAAEVHDSESGERVAREVLKALDVSPSHLAALADVPAKAFSDVQAKIRAEGGRFLTLPFRPTVDGTTLPVAPISGLPAGVPLLIGTNEEEMKLWSMMAAFSAEGVAAVDEATMLRRIGRQAGRIGSTADPAEVAAAYRRRLGPGAPPAEVLEAVGTDVVFRLPAIELAEAQGANAPTFMYLFTHRATSFAGSLGSAHATEIPFVFDNLDEPGTHFLVGDVTPERRELATTMADAWVAFATTGDPTTPTLGSWPAYDTTRRSTMRLDTPCGVVDDPHGDERRVWTN